jgi:hypothetical protein
MVCLSYYGDGNLDHLIKIMPGFLTLFFMFHTLLITSESTGWGHHSSGRVCVRVCSTCEALGSISRASLHTPVSAPHNKRKKVSTLG